VHDPLGHAWHLFVIQLEPERLTIDRDTFVRRLIAMNIGVPVHFIPLHLHPYYRDRYGCTCADFPNASAAFRRIVSLPLYPKLTDADVEDVVAAVRALVEEHQR